MSLSLVAIAAMLPLQTPPPQPAVGTPRTISLRVRIRNAEGEVVDAGRATITQKLVREGGKSVEVRVETGNVTTIQQAIYDSAGRPMRRYVQMQQDLKPKMTKIVTFDAKGANVVIDRSGQRETKSVPLPGGLTLANPSEFWFIRDTPKVGATVKHAYFSDQDEWLAAKSSYRGKAPVPGKNDAAHYVTLELDERKIGQYFSDTGLLLAVRDSIGMTMDR
ncbi:MAG: hypothetical protein SFX74_07635 [Fimbriimonadaceae bacterium]|nr:hypothetical protein [Fimbriimonadaceae bacterium]